MVGRWLPLAPFGRRIALARSSCDSAVAIFFALALASGALAEPIAEEDEPRPTEVTVAGERPLLPHSRRAPTVASTVIAGAALREAGASSAQVLARVPGVQVSRSGSEADLATASIRGADSRQTPVYLAGIRINDDVTGTADLSTIPLWMIERVEVFRGNAPEQADRLGLGGAVFFWPRLPQTARAGAMAHVGSYGERGFGLAHEAGTNEGGALVSLRAWRADNDFPYVNDFGQRFSLRESEQRRQNADFAAQDAWAIGRYRLGPGARVNAVINAFQRDQGVTGLGVIPAEQARAEVARLLAGVSTQVRCAASEEACSLELSTSYLGARSLLDDPAGEIGLAGEAPLDNRGQRLQQRAAITMALADAAVATLSVQQALETLHIDRTSDERRRARRLSTQPSLGVKVPLHERFTSYGLLAVECHTTDATFLELGQRVTSSGQACGTLEPVGRVGARYEIGSGVELVGNVGRYVRAPTLGELYGSSPAVQGNVTLRPEAGVASDIGVRASRALDRARQLSLGLDAFVFARWAEHMIRYQRVSSAALAPFNVASARVLGLETAVALDWHGHLRAQTALTLLDPRETTARGVLDPTQNDVLPLTSRLVTSSELEAYLEPDGGSVERAALGVRHLHRASRFEDPAGLTVLPAQDFFDVYLVCLLYQEALGVRASLNNVLAARSLDLLGLPLPGRTFHLSVEGWL